MSIELAEQVVQRWRTDASSDNPAGPLFTSGVFTVADLIDPDIIQDTHPCSSCTASTTHYCC